MKTRVYKQLPNIIHLKKGTKTVEQSFFNYRPTSGVVSYMDEQGEIHLYREDKLRQHLNLPEFDWE